MFQYFRVNALQAKIQKSQKIRKYKEPNIIFNTAKKKKKTKKIQQPSSIAKIEMVEESL